MAKADVVVSCETPPLSSSTKEQATRSDKKFKMVGDDDEPMIVVPVISTQCTALSTS
jgi:hypothetical protein